MTFWLQQKNDKKEQKKMRVKIKKTRKRKINEKENNNNNKKQGEARKWVGEKEEQDELMYLVTEIHWNQSSDICDYRSVPNLSYLSQDLRLMRRTQNP